MFDVWVVDRGSTIPVDELALKSESRRLDLCMAMDSEASAICDRKFRAVLCAWTWAMSASTRSDTFWFMLC